MKRLLTLLFLSAAMLGAKAQSPGTGGYIDSVMLRQAISGVFSTANGLYYSIYNPQNFVTASVTNGLATTNYVNTVTNSYPWNGLYKIIGVTNYVTTTNDMDVRLFCGGTNQLLTTSNMLVGHLLVAFPTNVNGSLIVTNPSGLVLGSTSRTLTNGQHIATVFDGVNLN